MDHILPCWANSHKSQPCILTQHGRLCNGPSHLKIRKKIGIIRLGARTWPPVVGLNRLPLRASRFVIVAHSSKGFWFLLSTDTSLEALKIIRIYGLRFRIELSFKQAVHTMGTFCYRFWMRSMKPIRFGDGNQYLHRTSSEYRQAITQKIHAYHTFIQAGVIAQGLLLYLSATFPKLVWNSFGSWLRTIRPDVASSEFVVAQALRQSLPHFLTSYEERHAFTKFIAERQGPDNAEMFGMAA